MTDNHSSLPTPEVQVQDKIKISEGAPAIVEPMDELKTVEAKFHRCPRCGFELDLRPVKIEDSDKKNYIRALLSQDRFRKVYTLFGGRMTVGFKGRTLAEQDLIIEVCANEIKNETLTAAELYARMAVRRRLVTALDWISLTDKPRISFPAEGIKTAEQLAEQLKRLDTLGTEIYQALANAIYDFDALTAEFARLAGSPDFWQETAG